MKFSLFCLPFLSIFLVKTCPNQAETANKSAQNTAAVDTLSPVSATEKMTGLTFVAIPKPFKTAVMQDVRSYNAGWIAVIPYGYTMLKQPSVKFGGGDWQWWGETTDGIRLTIDSAHRAGIRVLLKPQVYVPYGWTGNLDFETDADWAKWEADYERYLMNFVEIAAEKRVDALCVGTEFKIGAVRREAFWRGLIERVRAKYKGKLTYAANWDEFPNMPFWDALDFAGINAYMPLSDATTPSVSELKTAWQPHFETIKNFQAKIKKPVAFTEFGYMSVDGCAGKGWEVESKVKSLKINELAQANALDALYGTFWNEPWWVGGFLWKWFPEGEGHEGYVTRDYTPQNKQAAAVVRKWYGGKGQ
jgi:hypothetical protein